MTQYEALSKHAVEATEHDGQW